MDKRMSPLPSTVEDVFRDFSGRRAGLIKALTTDRQRFFESCDPEKENLWLYGYPDGTWEVNEPDKEVAAALLPEPTVGINFCRDELDIHIWLLVVAKHSDSWLLRVAFFSVFRIRPGKRGRKKLFEMINELPTIREIVLESFNQPDDQSGGHIGGSSSKGEPSSSKSEDVIMRDRVAPANGELCAVCDGRDEPGAFWIHCSVCCWWYHCECVGITPKMAEENDKLKCKYCKYKK